MNWSEKNIFVTGASGFVGSWVTKGLVERGANVIILIRDEIPRSHLYYIDDIYDSLQGIVRGDLTEYRTVERIFNEYDIDICFHLAAQALVSVANRSPVSTFESNIKGTWNILEAARNCNEVESVVVASSDKAYGEHDTLPYTEDFCLKASHPYDASKACADILSKTYQNTYHLPVTVSRCANIYGGDLNFSRIVPDTIKQVLMDKNPIIRSDGSPVREYMYIMDAVKAYLSLAENIDITKGKAFNFGTNEPTSVLELVNKIIEISGRSHLKPEIRGKGKQKGEIHRQYLSSEKARKKLDWQTDFSLEEGLKETLNWYVNYFKTSEI